MYEQSEYQHMATLFPNILTGLLGLILLSFLVFMGTYYIGDPLQLLMNNQMVAMDLDAAEAVLGLDQPLISQYVNFITGLIQGDLGVSYIFNRPALNLILERLPASLELAILAITISACLGVPLGLYALRNQDLLPARMIRFFSVFGLSFPLYVLALLLVSLFAAHLNWLPALGRGETVSFLGIEFSFLTQDGWRHLCLPLISLSMLKTSLFVRYTLYFGHSVTQSPAVHFAKARGLPNRRIYYRHVLKNILVPLSSLSVIEFGGVLVSAVITENIFAWPGVGKLLIDSIHHADRPVLIVFILFVALFYIIINFAVETFHRIIDPRLMKERK